MICEYCGGALEKRGETKYWISFRCVNCHATYACRPTKEYHIATLKAVYEDRYEFVIKEYKRRKKELIENAEV